MAEPTTIDARARTLKRSLVTLAILAVIVVALLLAVPGFDGVEAQLAHAELGWIAVAVVLEFLSGVGYVLTFHLVFDRVPHRFARRLAWSEQAFQGAVSLGGVGGLGLGAWVLHVIEVPTGWIAQRSTVFFILTSAVNVFVLAFFGLGIAVGVFDGPGNLLLSIGPGAVGVAVIAIFLLLPRFADRLAARFRSHERTATILGGLSASIHETESLLHVRDWRLVGAFGYLLFDIAVLWACFEALGGAPPVAALVLAYQIGYMANVVPIPGGIGALDAGIVGALLLYGADAAQATAAVIAYHAIALWVPATIGTIAFALLRRDLRAAPAPP
ncbi:MAG: hypothetical protein QOJ57_1424 [Thermoleophilaceae bacterium]|nr:hypothetical protein [Thermoleophilaceae bacterium]